DKGNIRDYANVSQLVCLANLENLENLNAHFIQQKLEQPERLRILNNTAIQQMRLLTEDKTVRQLK
ncbi:MAG: KilA-N domain-containing protein, partial [Desulfonatronovibrio sp.]